MSTHLIHTESLRTQPQENVTHPFSLEKEKTKPSARENHVTTRLQPPTSIVLLYLGTAFLGSLVSSILPLGNSYFSDKRNLLNVVFVKFGWGWTSVFYLLFVTMVFAGAKPQKAAPFWFRWWLATLYWYFVTQRFMGPSVTDRFFVLSGGACSVSDVHDSFTCKSKGGKWTGGHDMSGHCMLLIHASLFIWEEVRLSWFDGKLNERVKANVTYRLLRIALIGLWCLWWWMLLMTNLYFHSFPEKISGVVSGVLYWYLGYIWIFPYTNFPGTPQANLLSLFDES